MYVAMSPSWSSVYLFQIRISPLTWQDAREVYIFIKCVSGSWYVTGMWTGIDGTHLSVSGSHAVPGLFYDLHIKEANHSEAEAK